MNVDLGLNRSSALSYSKKNDDLVVEYYPYGRKRREGLRDIDGSSKGIWIRWDENGNIYKLDTLSILGPNGPCMVRSQYGYTKTYYVFGIRYASDKYDWKVVHSPQNWSNTLRGTIESYDDLDEDIIEHMSPDSKINKDWNESYKDVFIHGIGPSSPEPYNNENLHFHMGMKFDHSEYQNRATDTIGKTSKTTSYSATDDTIDKTSKTTLWGFTVTLLIIATSVSYLVRNLL
jgi:hypothetical protein